MRKLITICSAEKKMKTRHQHLITELFTVYMLLLLTSSITAGRETPVSPTPIHEEPDLYHFSSKSNVMDTLFGQGNYTRVDDAYDEVWKNWSLNGKVRERARFSADSSILYYNSLTNPPVSLVNSPPGCVYFSGDWIQLPCVEEQFTWLFKGGDSFLWSSKESENVVGNSTEDHMVTFMITNIAGKPDNVMGNYVLAWEDRPLLTGGDYQDHVFEVSLVGLVIPEPATVVILVLGGLALFGRRQR